MDKYFITGSNFFIDKNIKLCTPKDNNTNAEIFFGDELNKEEFFNYINSADLFGNQKVAIIRNAEKTKNIEQLVTKMSKCSETTLIVTSLIKDKLDQPLINIFKKNNFTIFSEETKKKQATVYDVIDIFKEKNIILNKEQAEIVFNKCLNNLSIVENEANKLEIYLISQKENINTQTLLEQISDEKEENIFAIANAFATRDIKTAFNVYKMIDNSNDIHLKIFCALSQFVIQLYLLFIDETYLKQLHPYKLKILKEQKRKWTLKELIKMIDFISELDKDIKTGIKNVNNAVLSVLLSVNN